MKMESKGTTMVAAKVSLSLGVLMGATLPMTVGDTAEAVSKVSSVDVLSSLTQDQRDALNNMQVNEATGLHLDPTVNLESDEEISVIVEFKEKPQKVALLEAKLEGKSLSNAKANQLLDENHDKFQQDLKTIFKGELQKKKSFYKMKQSFKYAFNGVSMTLPASSVNRLLDSDEVKAVWSNRDVQLELPIKEEESKQEASLPKAASSNSYLRVDQLHNEGITGDGVKVGVLDTGIDYNHPDLKDAYKGGYDFVDDDTDPMETTYADWKDSKKSQFNNGNSYYTEHGTHVAGIIAGQGMNESEYSTTGVAPDAELYAYRVLGPYGSGTMEAILSGIDQAVADEMDVINLSLGANINDPMFPTSVAINNAVLSGVTAVVAAGNSGDDMYTLGSPAASALALTVGASDVPIDVATFDGVLQTGEDTLHADVRLMAKPYAPSITELEGQSFPIVDAGIGRSINYSGKNVTGKMVLVARGDITLNDKVKYAKQKGAAGVMIYNNNPDEGHIPYYLGESTEHIPTFSLSNQEGLALLEKIQSGDSTFTFGQLGSVSTEGDALADFSSRGPSRLNYDIKPEIVAPGVSIMSTVPSYIVNKEDQSDYQYAYQRLSGTSMATPYAAGVAALMLEHNPDLLPEEVKTIMMNTADPLKKPYSVFEVGAGRVDPYEAVHSDMEIMVVDETPIFVDGEKTSIKEKTGAMSFGSYGFSGKNIRDQRTVVLSNTSGQEKTFDVDIAFQTGTRDSLDGKENGVEVKAGSTVKVKGNSQKKTNVSITVPKTAEKGTYEGYVVYTNQDNKEESYQVPFAIRVVEEGIEELFFNKTSMATNPNDGNPIYSPYLPFGFQLKSHMETIDFVLADGKTGEDIGYVGWLDGKTINENIAYGWLGYDGSYRPFTDNDYHPISDKVAYASQGHYKLKMIGRNADGETFTKEQDFFVDNTKPEFQTNLDGKTVIEYPADQTSYPITATLIDHEVSDMQALGFDIDQTQNNVALTYSGFSGYPDTIQSVDQNGHFEYSLPLDNRRDVMTTHIDGLDAATNRGKRKTVYFLKEGTPYVTADMDKEIVKPGDTVKYSMTVQNVKDLKESRFTMKIDPTQVEIEDVNVRPEASSYGDVSMKHDTRQVGPYLDEIFTLTFDANQEITGDIPMIDVYVKVKDEKWLTETGFLTFDTVLWNQADQWKRATPFFKKIAVNPNTSHVRGDVISQGLLTENNALNSELDYSTIGANVTLWNEEGEKVTEDHLDKYSRYLMEDAPVSTESHTVSIDVPGHFTYYDTAELADEKEDGLAGKLAYIRGAYVVAGDVNKDNVIDVMDALAIQENWGTSNRAADINFDGTVDEKDMKFVKLNYMKQNSTLDYLKPGSSPDPKNRYKGHTLDSILKDLGVE